jgi:hypothetical protein
MMQTEQGLYPSRFSLAEALPGHFHGTIELEHGLIVGHRRALSTVDGH